MKKILTFKNAILTAIAFIFSSLLIAQNCTDVEELFRKRHTIGGMTYGHPYTTFDRHNENYINLQNAINNIRKNIRPCWCSSPTSFK